MRAPSFDKDQAVEILEAFERISGLGGTLFVPNEDGVAVDVIFSKNACAGKCPRCLAKTVFAQETLEGKRVAAESSGLYDYWTPVCQRVHCQAADFAERFGGRYFYQCSEDRIFFAAPIIADAGLVAALTIGPVHIYSEMSRILDPHLKPFPVREPAYIQYLSQLLAACAVSVSDSSQSLLRMMRQVTMEQQREIHGVMSRGPHAYVKEYGITLEDELASAVRAGDAGTARTMLNELLGMLLSARSSAGGESFLHRLDEIITVCSRAALKAGVSSDTMFGVAANYRKRLGETTTDEQRSYVVQRFIEQTVSLVDRVRNLHYDDDIYRATEYILANYPRKLTLEEVADEVGFSPAYFSRLFKKKFGQSFSEYLSKVRIDASKNNLLATNLPISEVARRSGFVDASYFTRAFKREVGVTPGFFRSHRGQVERLKERVLPDV
ncbi:MAG: AraC family transcriptional regulator [Eggerthellaceae bacterium]|nr:AraC family transcriptional regulator [Eggerthellaceae bacterium]